MLSPPSTPAGHPISPGEHSPTDGSGPSWAGSFVFRGPDPRVGHTDRVSQPTTGTPPDAPDLVTTRIPWIPVVAALVATLLALAVAAIWSLALPVLLQGGLPVPEGPTTHEVVSSVLHHLVAPLLAAALLALSWRRALQGRNRACWALGAASTVVGVAVVLL